MIKQILVASIVTMSSVAGFMQAQPPMAHKTSPSDVAAWILGTKLGTALVGKQAGESEAVVNELVATSSALAGALGVKVPTLPNRSDDTKTEPAAEVQYFMLNGVTPISQQLTKKYDRRHADLFEIAMKSSLLAIIYVPGDDQSLSLAKELEDHANRCKLPGKTWRPLIDSIRKKESFDVVTKTRLREMHNSIREHLLAMK